MQNRILSLSRDLPQLWANPAVIDRERKEILALLIQDVTILSEQADITTHVRLRGGACHTLTVTRSSIAPRKRTPPDIVARIDQLLEIGDDATVAQELNASGVRNWRNASFTKGQIANIRKGRALRSHRKRRLADGYATAGELAARYNVTRTTIRYWALTGLLERSSCGKRHRWYYRVPAGADILKGYGGPYAKPAQIVPASTCNAREPGAVR
jgi:hypothetical protein